MRSTERAVGSQQDACLHDILQCLPNSRTLFQTYSHFGAPWNDPTVNPSSMRRSLDREFAMQRICQRNLGGCVHSVDEQQNVVI